VDSNYKWYDYGDSFKRIDTILATPQGNYEEVKELPDREDLTFTNGFYASCSAIFVDIRDSSGLPAQYQRPKLAKLYRAYISEVVAIFNGSENAREINIVGDGVWAVFNTPLKADIDGIFELTAKVNSLVEVLNYKLKKAGFDKGPIRVGIGASDGRALMIKAGYSGSGINDVVYMGDVVNHAAKLAAQASKGGAAPVFISNNVFDNLKEAYAQYPVKNWTFDCYTANVVNVVMNDWYEENCK
jgi:class 3 adenylate cyclase